MEELLHRLLTVNPATLEMGNVQAWWSRFRAFSGTPADRAMLGGFHADRAGYAFASGYQAAVQGLFPELEGVPTALCATEKGGVHPRAIRTRLEEWKLSGEKSLVTLGPFAETLVVLASKGLDGRGFNRLAAVLLPADREGISLELLPAHDFIPEIPHARVRLEGVRVEPEEVAEGDGYDRYLKPFRTVEDSHVLLALLAWHLRLARLWGWPDAVREQLLVKIVTFRALALADPRSTAVHLALGTALEEATRNLDELDVCWLKTDKNARQRWHRDRPLLRVASRARLARLERAREKLLGARPTGDVTLGL